MLSFATVVSAVHSVATSSRPPGRYRRLHILCSGEGAPTVVLEAGASSFAIDWTLVQRGVSRTVRTYLLQYPDDVAGLVFVDPASEHRLLTMLNGEAVLIAELTAEQLATTFPRSAVRVPRRSPQRGVPFD